MQVARTAVVAQPAPQRQHVVQVGRCQGLHIREALQETGVVVAHRDHLGLLQHDLGQPHPVRVARGLPGQVIAPVLLLPAHQPRGEVWRHHAQACASSGCALGAGTCGERVR